jgi:hypothetical protein
LFTFNVKDRRIDGLAGVSVEDATLKMDSVTAQGALLITHWGLSGPAVLRCSAWGAREMFEKKYKAKLLINWLGDYSLDKALDILENKEWRECRKKFHQRHFHNPSAIVEAVDDLGEKFRRTIQKPAVKLIEELIWAVRFKAAINRNCHMWWRELKWISDPCKAVWCQACTSQVKCWISMASRAGSIFSRRGRRAGWSAAHLPTAHLPKMPWRSQLNEFVIDLVW